MGIFKALMILMLLGMTGCVLDGFTLSPSYRPTHPGATEPVASGSTWKLEPTSNSPVTVYLRVFRVKANAYALEQFIDEGDGKPATLVITSARFVPLGASWYALHWQEKDMRAQGYYVVRLESGSSRSALSLLEPSVQSEKITAIAQSQGINLVSQKLQTGLTVDVVNEARVLQLLKTLTTTSGLRSTTLVPVLSIPLSVSRPAYAGLGKSFSLLESKDFSDQEQGQRIAGYFEALHATGNGWGSYGLARLRHHGWSVPKDLPLARELARQAMQRGVPHAANLLGIHAYYGMGEQHDSARAVKYFQQAADADEPRAYLMLGIAHMEGQGVPKDADKARFWLEKAEHADISQAKQILTQSQVANRAESNADWPDKAIRFIDQEIVKLAKKKRVNISEFRAKNKDAKEFKTVAVSREMRELILSGRELGTLGPTEHQNELSKAHRDIVRIESMSRDYFGMRLPDGRIAALKPDGKYVALNNGSDTKFEVNTLPRTGDQWISRSDESILMEYEQAWSGIPTEAPKLETAVAELNRLVGAYRCEQKLMGITLLSRQPQSDPAITLDISGVLQHRSQRSVASSEKWEDSDWYAPLGKLSRVEAGRTVGGCGFVSLQCAQNRACAVSTAKGDSVEARTVLSMNFPDPEKARRAAELLQGLIGQRY